jgi:hypothetical protein|tara:strand:+ start:36 stop:245 length:210 start_codon:yes stop_codon:yes gene_type:complete
MRIARKIETDKRTKRRIFVTTDKTQCFLHFDQVTLKLKLPEAKRIAEQLSLSVEIIHDRKSKKEELRII